MRDEFEKLAKAREHLTAAAVLDEVITTLSYRRDAQRTKAVALLSTLANPPAEPIDDHFSAGPVS